METNQPPSEDLPDQRERWPERLARVRRSQARTDLRGMTRPPRDPDERRFLAECGLLGPFVETDEHGSASGPVRRASLSDTSPEAERVLIEGYRRMNPREKLQRVVALNRALEQLARARLRVRYGEDLSERELRLRLGALRLDREVMVRAFGWDPEVEGY